MEEPPIEREDVLAIMRSLFAHTQSSTRSSNCLEKTMKKKRPKKISDGKTADREMIEKLEERIAYHEAKLAEDRAARGENAA